MWLLLTKSGSKLANYMTFKKLTSEIIKAWLQYIVTKLFKQNITHFILFKK